MVSQHNGKENPDNIMMSIGRFVWFEWWETACVLTGMQRDGPSSGRSKSIHQGASPKAEADMDETLHEA
jgi:hypothetical protein